MRNSPLALYARTEDTDRSTLAPGAMRSASGCSKESGTTDEDGRGGNAAKAASLNELARMVADDILQSSLNQIKSGETGASGDLKMLAEGLATVVVDSALMEVATTSRSETQTSDLESCKDDILQCPHTATDPASFYHPGFPSAGSLDYPDAPPTTPLLPELERSRSSFARKLKGGLATVYLPSPPPPTPKDEKESRSDPHVELVEQLMHSLSTEDHQRGHFVAGCQFRANLEGLAETWSCDIVDGALRETSRKMKVDSSVEVLAQQMAETVIRQSLDKTKSLE